MNNKFATFAAKQFTQAPGALNVVGTMAEALAQYPKWRKSSSGMSIVLYDEAGKPSLSLVLSKNLRKAIENGELQANQLGHCNIIDGKNEAGEERLYLTLPAEYRGLNDSNALTGGEMPKAPELTLNDLKSLF